MPEHGSLNSNTDRLGISVAWSYAFAALLVLFIFMILVPEADGPSPWDPVAFKARMLDVFANFRILDEMAELGIVRVADVGDGVLNVKLSLLSVSDRRFGWAPFYLAITLVTLALLMRGLRQRLLAGHFGLPSAVRGQASSYFFGRGLNLFFPFGVGELGAVENLTGAGAKRDLAASVVFHNRLFEVLGTLLVLFGGFFYLGWQGAVAPMIWSLAVVVAVVSLTRPLGRTPAGGGRFNVLRHLWSVFNGRALADAARALASRPGFLAALVGLSIVTLLLEALGYWFIKQAFSSPLDDYVLMRDLAFGHFLIVVAVANASRILPYTFASLGIAEIVSIAMFRVFGEGPLGGATIAFLDSLLLNTVTLAGFIVVLGLGRCPSVIETWREFVTRSARPEPVPEEAAS